MLLTLGCQRPGLRDCFSFYGCVCVSLVMCMILWWHLLCAFQVPIKDALLNFVLGSPWVTIQRPFIVSGWLSPSWVRTCTQYVLSLAWPVYLSMWIPWFKQSDRCFGGCFDVRHAPGVNEIGGSSRMLYECKHTLSGWLYWRVFPFYFISLVKNRLFPFNLSAGFSFEMFIRLLFLRPRYWAHAQWPNLLKLLI